MRQGDFTDVPVLFRLFLPRQDLESIRGAAIPGHPTWGE
jgi:hypothetical protein